MPGGRKRGRPPMNPEDRKKMLSMRATQAELDSWRAASMREGSTMSAWIRSRLNAAAKRKGGPRA